MSLRASTFLPSACSDDIYATCPDDHAFFSAGFNGGSGQHEFLRTAAHFSESTTPMGAAVVLPALESLLPLFF